jgi:hypothetical protein
VVVTPLPVVTLRDALAVPSSVTVPDGWASSRRFTLRCSPSVWGVVLRSALVTSISALPFRRPEPALSPHCAKTTL